MRTPIRALATALFVLCALIASACGSDSPSQASTAPEADGSSGSGSSSTGSDGTDTTGNSDGSGSGEGDGSNGVAASNGNPATALEILDVETGETTTIAGTVTGDRPVLLWFWAPH